MRQAFLLAASCLALLTPPAAQAQPPTLASYWPHEDGRSWFYDQHAENLVRGETFDNQARLYFDGTTFAAGGIAAQVLTGTVAPPPAARAATFSRDVPAEVKGPFLQRLWVARPDLRAGILRTAALAPCPSNRVEGWELLLLSAEFAYVQNASEVGAWRCDAANTRSWLWLTSDLSPGATATIPLVPDLADDVTLKLTVLGLVDATVPGGTFQDCLHVNYLIDYGESMCTDQSGNPLGTSRAETRGFVRYAPEVGPVECSEEFFIENIKGSCADAGLVARGSLKLNAPSVAARPSSWGRLKSTYRP